MTELTITPKIADKTARFKGTVAAGEHVAVTIKGGSAWLGDDNGEHLSLRVLDLVTGRTLAVFPRPPETLADGDDPDEWSTSAEDPNDLFCNLNLNTDRMVNAARHMLRVPVLFVMGAKDDENPAATRTLYFRDRHEVEFWPERVGDDTPYDLDRWPKQIDEWTDLIAEFETRIDTAEDSIRDAVDEADGIVSHVDDAKIAAQNSATAAGDSASAAQTSAATAKNWATGGGETGDPGATNNAKYYAQQAGASATSADASATAAAGSATSAEGSATSAAGSATAAASSAQSAAGAAEAAVETEKERAEGAESDLADAIDAEKERAEGAEALAIVNAEYNGTSRRIVFTTGGGETKAIDASAFIKDGMISSVSVSNGNLVITFNSDAGKQPISIPLAQIFNPSNYYDKTAADDTFVKKDGAKGLSTNDYTTADKQKLAGIEPGAQKNVGVEFTQAEKEKLAGAADSDDLRYRIANANSVQTGWNVPDSLFPIGFTFNGTAYSIPLSSKDDVSLRFLTGDTWSLACLADGVSVDVSTFNNGVFSTEMLDVSGTLTFNNARPVVGTTSLDPAYGYALADRTVNLIKTYNNQTSLDIELPAAVTVDDVSYARDFFLDVDNYANANDLALEFTRLGVDYAFVPSDGDSISEMTSIGAGERVRLYFTETPHHASGASLPMPVIHVARVTLGDFVTSTATQGDN